MLNITRFFIWFKKKKEKRIWSVIHVLTFKSILILPYVLVKCYFKRGLKAKSVFCLPDEIIRSDLQTYPLYACLNHFVSFIGFSKHFSEYMIKHTCTCSYRYPKNIGNLHCSQGDLFSLKKYCPLAQLRQLK